MTTTTTTRKKRRPSTKTLPVGKITVKDDALNNENLPSIEQEQRLAMIAETAYLIAERRKFQSGSTMDDWLQAEADVDARIASASHVSH